MAEVRIQFSIQAPSYVTDNADKVLEEGEPLFLNNGQFAFGDGVTTLEDLTFFGGSIAWGNITGDPSDNSDLTAYINELVTAGASWANLVGDPTDNTELTTYVSSIAAAAATGAINTILDGAPANLDTLNEIAAAINDDANVYATLVTLITGKQAQLDGTGFVKVNGTTVTYDNNTYLTAVPAVTSGQVLYGSGTGYTSSSSFTTDGTNVGIGGVNASFLLNVQRSSNTQSVFRVANTLGAFSFGFDSVGGFAQAQTAGKGMAFYNAAGTTFINVKGAGGVDITSTGVTTIASPGSPLVINSTNSNAGKIVLQSGGTVNCYFGSDTSLSLAFSVLNASQVTKLAISTSGHTVISDRLYIGSISTTPTALLHLAAGTTAVAQARWTAGVAPTSPNNGDEWFDGTNKYIRVGGVTKTYVLS